MNPLPRLLGLGLLAVLVALAVVLALPLLARAPAPAAEFHQAPSAPGRHPVSPGRLTTYAGRIALPLALTGLVLATALIVSLSLRSARAHESRAPFAAARSEVGALTKLAQTSAAQGEALAHERGVRRLAEENAQLNEQLLARSLEERVALGRDLHDGIIQSLYAAGLTIESARALAPTDPAEADRRLAQCLQSLNQAIRDLRAYIAGLSPESLRQAGFAQAIAGLVAELGAGRDVHFDLKIDENATVALTAAQSTEALQIAREAISNSLRHGRASHVTVRLHPGDGEVCLLVQDDGAGFDPAQRAAAGHGLGNMQARARRLGAAVRLDSRPGEGTRVVLTFPLARPA